MRDVIVFGLIRLALWAVLWWLLALAGLGTILAGLVAVLIAMMLSFLFLNRQRDAAAMSWQEADERRRENKVEKRDEDADAEDALVDAAASDADGSDDSGESVASDDSGEPDDTASDAAASDASEADPGEDRSEDQSTRPTSSSSE
ncbi:DUF4229 domain-containing protein [Brachybacterium sp. DNPG3]